MVVLEVVFVMWFTLVYGCQQSTDAPDQVHLLCAGGTLNVPTGPTPLCVSLTVRNHIRVVGVGGRGRLDCQTILILSGGKVEVNNVDINAGSGGFLVENAHAFFTWSKLVVSNIVVNSGTLDLDSTILTADTTSLTHSPLVIHNRSNATLGTISATSSSPLKANNSTLLIRFAYTAKEQMSVTALSGSIVTVQREFQSWSTQKVNLTFADSTLNFDKYSTLALPFADSNLKCTNCLLKGQEARFRDSTVRISNSRVEMKNLIISRIGDLHVSNTHIIESQVTLETVARYVSLYSFIKTRWHNSKLEAGKVAAIVGPYTPLTNTSLIVDDSTVTFDKTFSHQNFAFVFHWLPVIVRNSNIVVLDVKTSVFQCFGCVLNVEKTNINFVPSASSSTLDPKHHVLFGSYTTSITFKDVVIQAIGNSRSNTSLAACGTDSIITIAEDHRSTYHHSKDPNSKVRFDHLSVKDYRNRDCASRGVDLQDITNVEIVGGIWTNNGGNYTRQGILNLNRIQTVVVDGVTFSDNLMADAGVIHVEHVNNLIVRQSFFKNNQIMTASHGGTGIYVRYSDSVVIVNSKFEEDSQQTYSEYRDHSHIFIQINAANFSALIDTCRFLNNALRSITFEKDEHMKSVTQPMVIRNSKFVGNHPSMTVAATVIHLVDTTARVEGCLFSNNNATLVLWQPYFLSTALDIHSSLVTWNGHHAFCIDGSKLRGAEAARKKIKVKIGNTRFVDSTAATETTGIYVYKYNAGVSIHNCTFERNTFAPALGGGPGSGCILCRQAPHFYLHDSYFGHNTVMTQGGAFSSYSCGFTITNCVFEHNYAAVYGGAIYAVDGTHQPFTHFNQTSPIQFEASSTALILDSHFHNNTAAKIGGALFIQQASFISRSTFVRNTAREQCGGAVFFNHLDAVHISMWLESVEMSHNIATTHGAAVCSLWYVFIRNGTFMHNSADIQGGALFSAAEHLQKAGNLTVMESTFSHNTAQVGGAISNSVGTLKLVNTVLTHNTATLRGGAIDGGDVEVDHCTISHNKAGHDGGGLHSMNNVQLHKSEFLHNYAKNNGGGVAINWHETNPGGSDSCILHSVYFFNNTAEEGFGGGFMGMNCTFESFDRCWSTLRHYDGNCSDPSHVWNSTGIAEIDQALYMGAGPFLLDHDTTQFTRHSRVWIQDSAFIQNTACAGGAFSSVHNNVVVVSTVMENNTALLPHCDDVDCTPTTTPLGPLWNSPWYADTLLLPGIVSTGGAAQINGGTLIIQFSIVRGNRAYCGGGIMLQGVCNAHVSHVEINRNVAHKQGGGVVVDQSVAPVIFRSHPPINAHLKDSVQHLHLLELTKNTAEVGGGVYFTWLPGQPSPEDQWKDICVEHRQPDQLCEDNVVTAYGQDIAGGRLNLQIVLKDDPIANVNNITTGKGITTACGFLNNEICRVKLSEPFVAHARLFDEHGHIIIFTSRELGRMYHGTVRGEVVTPGAEGYLLASNSWVAFDVDKDQVCFEDIRLRARPGTRMNVVVEVKELQIRADKVVEVTGCPSGYGMVNNMDNSTTVHGDNAVNTTVQIPKGDVTLSVTSLPLCQICQVDPPHYSPGGKGECKKCPENAATCAPGFPVAAAGYWAWEGENGWEMKLCPLRDLCMGDNKCDNHRNISTPVCSQCEDGFEVWGEGCVSECTQGWIISLEVIGAVVALNLYAQWLLVLSNMDSDGASCKLFLFYHQMAGLVLAKQSGNRNVILKTIKKILGIMPDTAAVNLNICVYKLGAAMEFHLINFALITLIATLLTQWAIRTLYAKRCKNKKKASDDTDAKEGADLDDATGVEFRNQNLSMRGNVDLKDSFAGIKNTSFGSATANCNTLAAPHDTYVITSDGDPQSPVTPLQWPTKGDESKHSQKDNPLHPSIAGIPAANADQLLQNYASYLIKPNISVQPTPNAAISNGRPFWGKRASPTAPTTPPAMYNSQYPQPSPQFLAPYTPTANTAASPQNNWQPPSPAAGGRREGHGGYVDEMLLTSDSYLSDNSIVISFHSDPSLHTPTSPRTPRRTRSGSRIGHPQRPMMWPTSPDDQKYTPNPVPVQDPPTSPTAQQRSDFTEKGVDEKDITPYPSDCYDEDDDNQRKRRKRRPSCTDSSGPSQSDLSHSDYTTTDADDEGSSELDDDTDVVSDNEHQSEITVHCANDASEAMPENYVSTAVNSDGEDWSGIDGIQLRSSLKSPASPKLKKTLTWEDLESIEKEQPSTPFPAMCHSIPTTPVCILDDAFQDSLEGEDADNNVSATIINKQTLMSRLNTEPNSLSTQYYNALIAISYLAIYNTTDVYLRFLTCQNVGPYEVVKDQPSIECHTPVHLLHSVILLVCMILSLSFGFGVTLYVWWKITKEKKNKNSVYRGYQYIKKWPFLFRNFKCNLDPHGTWYQRMQGHLRTWWMVVWLFRRVLAVVASAQGQRITGDGFHAQLLVCSVVATFAALVGVAPFRRWSDTVVDVATQLMLILTVVCSPVNLILSTVWVWGGWTVAFLFMVWHNIGPLFQFTKNGFMTLLSLRKKK